MLKRCIINVAFGAWYPKGQDRLRESLKTQNFTGDLLFWKNEWPPNSPPHAVLPYGFKSYAFQEAARQGYETILWLDCSCWAIRPLEPLFDHIEREGHVFSYEGHMAGQWLKDAALITLGMTRDEAMKIHLFGGMFMGICTANERTQNWLHRYVEICQDGHTLTGSKLNVNNCHSSDPRCVGHTHDQSVGSVLAYQMRMPLTFPPEWRDWDRPDPAPNTVILARGM